MGRINESENGEHSENPLVTFALFAYNQEKYIREAVEGAFAQTYQPLEIILSDDCSTDQTLEIMEEMVAAYEGPHVVRLNKNPNNIGVVHHVFNIGSSALGEYVVVAAGDDISKPQRTEILVKAFRQPEVWAITTGYDLVNESGAVLQQVQRVPNANSIGKYIELPGDDEFIWIQGSTAAYRKFVFEFNTIRGDAGRAEDDILTFYIHLKGGFIKHLNASLILYRMHQNAQHNRPVAPKDTPEFERNSLESCQPMLEKLRAFEQIARKHDGDGIVNIPQLREDIRQREVISCWPDKNLWQKLVMVAKEALFHQGRLFKWEIARIWGCYPCYQPKMVAGALRRRVFFR